MRKIIVLSFLSLDGVMQAPGRPDEDVSDGFEYGGWVAPYSTEADEAAGEFMQRHIQSSDLLLGRRTFDIFASYWPQRADIWPGINDVTKYVMSNTIDKSEWQNSVFLNTLDDIVALKSSGDSDLHVYGSGEFIQTLLKHDLVDELRLKIYPVTLGKGKRLFGEGTLPAAFSLTDSLITSNGVIFANYSRAGDVKTGIIGD